MKATTMILRSRLGSDKAAGVAGSTWREVGLVLFKIGFSSRLRSHGEEDKVSVSLSKSEVEGGYWRIR